MFTRIANVVLALSLVAGVCAVAVPSRAENRDQSSSRTEIQVAFRQGGLKAAARASGGHYSVSTDWVSEVAHTLDSLVEGADAVVVGELLQNRGHLSASGEYITTDYRMRVERTLKGSVLPQSEVVFQVMGGTVIFEDGSRADIETKGFARPNTGARVVIFATTFAIDDPLMPPAVLAYANGAPIFRLVGMGRGIVELPNNENDRIRVNALGAKDPAARNMRSMRVRQFLFELAKVVRESRQAGRQD